MHYLMDDFASTTSTTTVQARRSRPRPLTVVVPGRLRLRVAPPSPLFGRANEHISAEPFPEFVDPCPPVKAEPLHCILHCEDNVCKRMVAGDIPMPSCRCGDDVDQFSPRVNTPMIKGPAISLGDTIFETILESASYMEAGQAMEIQRDDVRVLLEQFESIVMRRALANEEFMAIVRGHATYRPEAVAHDRVVHYLFELLSMYFERTMRDVDSRKVTADNLCAELKVYLYTGLADWMFRYSNRFEFDEIMKEFHDDGRILLEIANFGMTGAVSKLWTECLDDVVRLFVWRHVQTAKAKASFKICIAGISVLGVYSITAGIAGLLGFW
ncbi:hypothetical protein HBI70_201830 [Parastagonospora nodorum]|nr:hypothetical protein HBH53_219950 [Parastagonospora nodorum]KAH4234891.1 hypothetical protein HBI06_062590 [Parastagonospora nodorum]KAH4250171.1 hypothetical protein HBI05_014790 [Parastagonospora nodorum]KAH4960550.1 hypothetical protein HBI78_156310 [Parastagonospora nodorum]KAH5161855.1 hypothetical protein HBH69_020800 [Parastagonospora nodorum]